MMASASTIASGYGSSPSHMLYIPAGLLMLFFGGFLMKGALCIVSCTLVSKLMYGVTITAQLDAISSLTLITLSALVTFLLVLEACEQGPSFATGFVLGLCIALTFYPAPMSSMLLSIIILSPTFGFIFSLIPREVEIFITSYGGGYMIFFGMELIDSDVFQGTKSVPQFVNVNNGDMWFSVLSFLIVGLLGCCVQLILISGQVQRTVSRSHYLDIP